jgi:hypothetical protein
MAFEGNINGECCWKSASTLSALGLPGTTPFPIGDRLEETRHLPGCTATFRVTDQTFLCYDGAALPGERPSVFKIVFHIYISFFSLA